MNQTQEYRDRFPGIEPKEDMTKTYRIRSFSSYQKERTVIECMEDTLWDMDIWDCECVVVKSGEHWWDAHRFYRRDALVSILFESSLAMYVTKFQVERKAHDKFILHLKLHELTKDVKTTNLGADLIEYIGNMVEE